MDSIEDDGALLEINEKSISELFEEFLIPHVRNQLVQCADLV